MTDETDSGTIHGEDELIGEPLRDIRVGGDTATLIFGYDGDTYHSIEVSGELLTVERGPEYVEDTRYVPDREDGDE